MRGKTGGTGVEIRHITARQPKILIVAGLTIVFALTGCSNVPDTGGGPSQPATSTPTALQRVEVREYEGKDLSSVEDFRENSIKGPQQVDRDAYRLKVHGLVATPLELTYDEVVSGHKPYRKVVTLNCVEGWSVDILWEGVLIGDLIDEAGAQAGATTVIFRSYDGYSTSLPLEYVRDHDILLASKMNTVELPPERGFPFEVVAEDKWGYKWARWVTEIELSSDTQFRGYWESRGYSTDGSLDNPSFGR